MILVRKFTMRLSFILILGLFISSCTEDNIGLNMNMEQSQGGATTGGNNDNSGGGTQLEKVYFNANVLSIINRAGTTSPILGNYSVNAFAYNEGSLITEVKYLSSNGLLTPDRKSTRLNSINLQKARMTSSA